MLPAANPAPFAIGPGGQLKHLFMTGSENIDEAARRSLESSAASSPGSLA